MTALLAGVFVGGAGRRMGGVAKGLLVGPDGRALVERTAALLAGGGAQVVLVGVGDAYAALGLERLADDPPGIGPLGGLVALLARADGAAIAVACDMPFVAPRLLARLVSAPAAPVVAPRRDGRWEPLFARYDAPRVLPIARAQVAAGDHALHRLLDRAGVAALALEPGDDAALRDWDTPDDVRG